MEQAEQERFGRWVKEERERRGMSGRQLAERAGVSSSTVSRVEGEGMNLSADKVKQIAAALDVPDLFALIEAGYIRSIGSEAAEIAVMYERLTGERRELARSVLRHLWERENASNNRGG